MISGVTLGAQLGACQPHQSTTDGAVEVMGSEGTTSMNDTPITERAFEFAARLSTFAHQRSYLFSQMQRLERENAKLGEGLRIARGDAEFERQAAEANALSGDQRFFADRVRMYDALLKS